LSHFVGTGTFFIGRDTRESGPRIEADLARGLAAEGASVASLGVAPTPAIAFLAQRAGAPAAIVSASHNPWQDNGVKLVGPDGRKLADDTEAAIESELQSLLAQPSEESRRSSAASAARSVPRDVLPRRTSRTCSALDGRSSTGCVVIDCAHGAVQAGAACIARRGGTSRCCTPSPTVATSATVRVDGPVSAAARWSTTAPISDWPSTETPIGWWQSTERRTRRRQIMVTALDWPRADAAQRRDRGNGDVEPGTAARA
jgi:hypothetical protein